MNNMNKPKGRAGFGFCRLVVILLLFFSVPVVAFGQDEMDGFLQLMNGEFRSDPTTLKEGESALLDRRVSVDAPLLGNNAVYLQVNTGAEETLYRQRLIVFHFDTASGTVQQQTWTFKEPEKYVNGFDTPEIFFSIGPDELELTLPEGCAQVWTHSGNEWIGVVNPERCRMWSERRQTWRRIGAESRLQADGLLQAERGFDDEGQQVFGTSPGEFHTLVRVE